MKVLFMELRDSSNSNRSTWGRAALTVVLVFVCFGQLQALTAQADPITVSQVTISLVRESSIPARDAGVLSKMKITEGQVVTKNDIVATLENDKQTLSVRAAELALQVATMRADDVLTVETAMAQLKEAESGRTVKEVALKIAEAEASSEIPIRVALAETKMRQLELDRAESARSSFKGSISGSELDRLRTAVRKGELETEQAENDRAVQLLKPEAERAALQQKDQEIERYRSIVAQEKKNLVIAKVNQSVYANEVSLAELQLEHRNIRAPFDGIIVKVESQVGEWVEPGAPIARVIDLKTLRAEGFLLAEQASNDLLGRSVTIQVNAGERTIPVTGTIKFVSPEVDPLLHQVRFWAEFDNSAMTIRPGMGASLIIEANPN